MDRRHFVRDAGTLPPLRLVCGASLLGEHAHAVGAGDPDGPVAESDGALVVRQRIRGRERLQPLGTAIALTCDVSACDAAPRAAVRDILEQLARVAGLDCREAASGTASLRFSASQQEVIKGPVGRTPAGSGWTSTRCATCAPPAKPMPR